MGKKRYIDTKFWSDVWVVDDLNPLDRYLFLYFLTNEKTNIAGVYEISLRTIAYETGIDKEELLRMLKRLETRIKYVDGWLILRNGINNQNYKNAKIKTGIELVLAGCPDFVFHHLDLPPDFKEFTSKNIDQQSLLDESSMTYGRYSDPNSNSNSNAGSNGSKKSHSTADSDSLLKKQLATEKPIKLGKGFKAYQEQKKKLQDKKSL